mmetsp:Transcript_34731/g.81794  ORF Transcript_34731/g.81794 Transcript_34731/m.81794 type:complete len:124 (-) Transcript_34731:57-428(-)
MNRSAILLLAVALCATYISVAEAATAEAHHILVNGEDKCLKIKEEIVGASDVLAKFKELAKEHSTCPSGKSGGSLGEFGPGQMVKEFNDVVFTTGKVGQVEGPVKTQFGYHLILTTRRGDEKM